MFLAPRSDVQLAPRNMIGPDVFDASLNTIKRGCKQHVRYLDITKRYHPPPLSKKKEAAPVARAGDFDPILVSPLDIAQIPPRDGGGIVLPPTYARARQVVIQI